MVIGSQIGPYRVDGLLGKGGMAEVWKAWHLNLHRHEALKVLPPQMTFDRSFVERFLNEARTAAGLQHPNIAVIHTVSEDDGQQPYFAMELVEGGDLSDLLESRGRMSLEEALPILQQIGAALDYAHGRGLMHRDVKPANILLNPDGDEHVVKVVDFGIARAQEEAGGKRLTKTGMIVGTPEYMSPEQGGSGAPVDHHTDIYSLAVIAYEMLCGQPPFRASSDTSAIAVIMDHIRTMPPEPRSVNPTLGTHTAMALMAGLAKEPGARPDSCAEFVSTLQSTGKARRALSTIPGAYAPTNRRISPALLIGVPLLAGASLIGYGLGNKGDGTMVVDAPSFSEGINQSEPTREPNKPTSPQPDPKPDPTMEIKTLVEEWRQARQARHLERIIVLYSPSATTSDGKAKTVSSLRSTLNDELHEQPRVEIGVSNVRVYLRGPNQALVVFQQHFKGWGKTPASNWESWGTKKFTLWRSSDGWRITQDIFKRDVGHRF